jgi:hypothetical protein
MPVSNRVRKTARLLGVVTVLVILLAFALATPQQADSATGSSAPIVRLPGCINGCTSISGSPLSIVAGQDGSYQVYFNGPSGRLTQVYQPLFDEADSGLFVKYKNWIIGPDFWNHKTSAANTYDSWASTSQTAVAGSGSNAAPWFIDTKVEHPASGVKLTARTTYVNGSNYFRIDWDVCTPAAGAVTTYLAADFYMQGGDQDPSFGVYDGTSGSVGAANESLSWLQSFTPLTPARRYFTGSPSALWAAIGVQGAPGPGLNNTVNNSAIDNAGGLQWDLNVNGCARVSANWSFGGKATGRSVIFVPNILNR